MKKPYFLEFRNGSIHLLEYEEKDGKLTITETFATLGSDEIEAKIENLQILDTELEEEE